MITDIAKRLDLWRQEANLRINGFSRAFDNANIASGHKNLLKASELFSEEAIGSLEGEIRSSNDVTKYNGNFQASVDKLVLEFRFYRYMIWQLAADSALKLERPTLAKAYFEQALFQAVYLASYHAVIIDCALFHAELAKLNLQFGSADICVEHVEKALLEHSKISQNSSDDRLVRDAVLIKCCIALFDAQWAELDPKKLADELAKVAFAELVESSTFNTSLAKDTVKVAEVLIENGYSEIGFEVLTLLLGQIPKSDRPPSNSIEAGAPSILAQMSEILAKCGRPDHAMALFGRLQRMLDHEKGWNNWLVTNTAAFMEVIRIGSKLDTHEKVLSDENIALFISSVERQKSWLRPFNSAPISSDEWFRDMAQLAGRLIKLTIPEDGPPWTQIRKDFEEFHINWVGWCLKKRSRLGQIIEATLSAQGRELIAVSLEQDVFEHSERLEGELAHLIPDPYQVYIRSRKKLAKIHREIARLFELRSEQPGDMRYVFGLSEPPDLPKDTAPERAQLQSLLWSAEAELDEVRWSMSAFSGVSEFAALGAAQEAIKLEALQAVLDADEQLLLLFSHGDSGHALLIGAKGAPEHLALPEMPAMVQQYKRLEHTLTGRGAVRRNTAIETEADEVEALSPKDYASFWADQEATLKRTLWDPLADKLVKGGTLLVASAGDLHNLSLEPGKPKHIGLMTRLPGLAFFALSRGLYGNNSASAAPAESTASVAILADDSAHDIPLVRREGELAARFWQEVGTAPEYPTNWPGGADRPLRFLHVAGHGTLQPGLAGSRHSVILQGETRIGEPEILRAPRAREALINICVAGQSHDNPLDGNPSGIVPGFLRHDTNWIVASLVALPDTWALLAGLILTDLRSASDADLPELLDKARTRLTHGGWPDRVSTAFAEALIAAINEPRYGPDRGTEGELNKRTSLRDAIDGDLAAARRDMLDRSRELIANSIRTNAPLHWWLAADPDLTERLIANPDDLDTTLNAAIKSAVAQAQSTGAPDLPEVQTTRHGWTLFGDPKKKA